MRRAPVHVSTLAAFLAALLVLSIPASAFACSIPIRRIGPIALKKGELKYPVNATVGRGAWGLDESWVSTVPRLSQFVIKKGGGVVYGATYKRQQALSLDALGPADRGWLYFSDDDPTTQECEMVGMRDWQPPVLRVKQQAKEIRVIAVTQRTVGDRSGCILGPDHGVAPCPNLTRVIFKLKEPVGERKLVFEVF